MLKRISLNTIRIIAASRKTTEQFYRECKLGISLTKLKFDPRIVAEVAFENTLGLPTIYNRAIHAAKPNEALLFVHDDISIDDFHLFIRLHEALQVFDVVGVVGNAKPDPRHIGWGFFLDHQNVVRWHDNQHLSGAIGNWLHGEQKISGFGMVPRPCYLLDGCFIAAMGDRLRERQIFFDEQFQFHFYDTDFCRNVLLKGLQPGTWPIAITHDSEGNFFSPAWKDALQRYLAKWAAVQ